MTTTTSATATPTATATGSSVVAGAAQSLLTSLGSGSGVDTGSLVTSLVNAQYAAQTAALQARADALTAQISGVASVRSAVTSFASALSSLVRGGTLQTQPVSADTAVLTASALPGASLAGLSSSVAVSQLAGAQTAVSAAAFADRTAAIGTGRLTLTMGTATYSADGSAMTGFTAGAAAPVTIDIAAGGDSLDGIAAAINAKHAGVTAAVVADADGSAYLSLKGATGAAQAFTLQASDDGGALARLEVGVGASGTRISAGARNAKLSVDGVAVERPGNTVTDLIAGVKLQLAGTSAAPVALTSSTPVAALSGAVGDFVDAYNEVIGVLKTQTDPIAGALRADPAANALLRSLKGLTLADLVPGAAAGTPTTLAQIGVATQKDGTLKLDGDRLASALSSAPAAVEAMFAYSAGATGGLSAALGTLTDAAASTSYGLGASTAGYAAQQSRVSAEQGDLATQEAKTTTRLTSQFAAMQTAVSSYKSVQSFLTNQIAAWNKSGS